MYRPSLRHVGLALVASACALVCAQSAGAATITVGPSGTIDAALDHAQPGDTILVETGTYADLVEASPRGTAHAPITLKPAPGAHPVISAGFKLIHARHVRVTDLTFDGTGNPAGFGTSIWDGQDITYARNEITGYGAWAQGVLVKEKSTGVRIVDNHIHHMGGRKRLDHGIYCESATGTVIEGNTINDIPNGYGIQLFGDCDDTRIVGNTIAGNGLSGITIGGNDDRGNADGTLIARNIIANHRIAAWSEYGFAITQYKAGRGNVVRTNVFWQNKARKNVDCDVCAVRDNTVRNPRFVDPSHGDYSLAKGSPARAVVAIRHAGHRKHRRARRAAR
jgi:parallel beta-helix repeat protein